jgi:hypothetical protein
LENLRTLCVEVWPKVCPPSIIGFVGYDVPDCWAVMENLVGWIREGFDKRGRKVDVRLVESANLGMKWASGRVEEVGGQI